MEDEAERVRSVYETYGASAGHARRWSSENPGNRLIREELVAAALAAVPDVATAPGGVLDVGCGSGWWLAELVDAGVDPSRLCGLDLLASRADAARRAVPGADVRQGDARALPWPEGRFRLVTLFLVLSSQEPALARTLTLQEARRVLAPGGDLLVWEPRLPNPGNRATRLVRRRAMESVLGAPVAVRPMTLLPPLARRVASTPWRYAALSRTRFLCTHRLLHFRG